jgi:hypothetical protein
MSKFSYKRVGMALIGLAVPFMAVGSAMAAPGADEVSSVELACLAYFDVSTCTPAVSDGVIDVVEDEVNADLSDQGVDYVVDVGANIGAEPGELGFDINAVAINPLPPLIPVPPVPGVPFQ